MSSGKMRWQGNGHPGAVEWLAVDPSTTGLLVVDVQYSCADPDLLAERVPGITGTEPFEAWSRRIHELVLPNTRALLAWFRAKRQPVLFTRVGSLLPNAEDQHPWRRQAWLRMDAASPPYRSHLESADYAILPEVAPQPGELVLDKNASGAFTSSPLDFSLHQMGLRTLVIVGVATFACVDNTARAAADRGYNVILVEDACAGSPNREPAHEATLRTFGRYLGAVKTTREVLDDLDALASVPAVAAGTPG